MNHWSDNLQLTSSDPTFALCEVTALFSLLAQKGVGPDRVLGECGMESAALHDTTLRISLEQHCHIQRSAAFLHPDPCLLPALARRLHLTTFGIVGYALLSSANLGELIRFADVYSPLLHLKFTLDVVVEGASAKLRFLDRYRIDGADRSACAVLELAKIGVLLKEVLGGEFTPDRASCVGADAAQLQELAAILGCAVEFSDHATEISFDASLLHRNLPQSNATTHSSCQQVCDELMAQLASRFNLERHVREIMLKATSRPPTLPELADELCISQRTLRRRLDALGTSYNQILEDVRKELAIRYLGTTQSTTEQIAQFLGYSEAANFRHAFKRWTGKSPREFRGLHGGATSGERTPRPVSAIGRRPACARPGVLLAEAAACWARSGIADDLLAEAA